MSFEEQFDKRVKQKIESAEFPFDEANWAKAAIFLDADKALTKVGNTTKIIVTALGLVTFISFGTYIALNYDEAAKLASKNTDTLKTTEFESKAHETAILNISAADNQTNSSNQNQTFEYQNSTKVTAEEVIANVKANKASKNTQPISSNITKSENLKVENNSRNLSPSELRVNSEVTQVQSLAALNETKFDDSESKEVLNEKNVKSKIQQQNNAQHSNDRNLYQQPTNDLNNTAVYSISTAQPDNGMEIVETNTTPTYEPSNIIGEKSNILGSELFMVQLQSIKVSSITSTHDDDIKQQAISLLQRYEEDYYKKGIKYKTHFLNVEAGINYWLGWNVLKQKDAKGFDWYAGVNYAYYVSKRIALGIGAQMFNLRNINQPFYSTEKTDYSFGSIKTSTVITTNQINYLAVPLKLYYRINRFNQVSVGLNTAYVYKTTNKVESLSTENSSVAIQNHTIYNDVQSLNYSLTLSYRVRTFNRWWLSFEGMYGLSDAFHGNLNSANFERPIGMRLGLQYNLLDK